jgi:hypothetical protein
MRRGITKLLEDTSNTVTINKDPTTSSSSNCNDYTIYGPSQYTRIELMLLKTNMSTEYIEELKVKKRKIDEKLIRKLPISIPVVEEINYNNIVEEAKAMSSMNSSMSIPISSLQSPPPPPGLPPPPALFQSHPGPPIQPPTQPLFQPPGQPSICQDQSNPHPSSHYGAQSVSQYGAQSGFEQLQGHYGAPSGMNQRQKKNPIKCRYGTDCHRSDCYYDHDHK